MRGTGRFAVALLARGALTAVSILVSDTARAYPQYSVNKDATYCRACHGDFRSANYVSLRDGLSWGSLHDLHRWTMLSGDCHTCHGAATFPVLLDFSAGGVGLAALGCVGCHGRAQDDSTSNPSWPNAGSGAGLRRHHAQAGVTLCAGCHADAAAGSYTPVAENLLPPYYANPGTGHPNMPTDPCNANGSEDFAGAPQGLDNDGDGIYDSNDSDCRLCGNHVIDPGETCDPPGSCPTTCDDGVACTVDGMAGSPATCDVVCTNTPITSCANSDGCCPAGCNAGNDNDCSSTCGDAVIQIGETCDPPAACPTTCDDGNACTTDTMTGSAATCDAACSNVSITTCTAGDGCCPPGCDAGSDGDCPPAAGAGAGGESSGGCSCASGGGAPVLAIGLLVASWRRRRRAAADARANGP